MKHEFRESFRAPKGLTADDAAQELERIRNEKMLTPANVVEESRAEDAPLHECFEWDDSKAANQHREAQARHLIRAIFVVHENQTAPIYYNVEVGESGRRYEHIEVVMQTPDLFHNALIRMKSDLAQAVRSVRELEVHAGSGKTKALRLKIEQAAEMANRLSR